MRRRTRPKRWLQRRGTAPIEPWLLMGRATMSRSDALHIAENLARVRGQMAEAARRSGRTPEAVTLVAVTKYAGTAATRALVEAGCRDLGESRPQDLWHKAAEIG